MFPFVDMSDKAHHSAVIEMHDVNIAALRDASLSVVDNVNWSVLSGEFWVVAGQQYSGKSDLLLHAAGLMLPARGTSRLFGCDPADFAGPQGAGRMRIGFVFADGKLFNRLTLAENIGLPLRYHQNLTDAAARQEVERWLELFELAPFADANPAGVPASWRQRAALARALVLRPELLLLDNPLAGLGVRHRQWLLDFLDGLWRGHDSFGGRPMTIVTTTDDLRGWRHRHRRFAALHQGGFSVLGAWDDEEFARHHAVKELLSAPLEANL